MVGGWQGDRGFQGARMGVPGGQDGGSRGW